MADYGIQGSFAFTCTNAEMALLEEVFQASDDLMAECDPSAPSLEFLAAFPPSDATDPFNGFPVIFDDRDFPSTGADLEGGNSIEDPTHSTVAIHGGTDFQPYTIAVIIQSCCKETLRAAPIGFEWACSCSKLRTDGFSGGWCAIFADRIEVETTGEALSRALEGGAI